MAPPIITGANLFRSKVVLTPADIYALDTSSIFIAPAIPGKTLVPVLVVGQVTNYTGSYKTTAQSFLIYGTTFQAFANLAYGPDVIDAIFTEASTPGGPFNLVGTGSAANGNFENEPLYLAAENAGASFVTGAAVAGTVGVPGAGYAPGDTGLINSDGIQGNYTVLTVDGGGGVLTVSVSGGSGFVVGNEYATQPLTGGGDGNLRIDITSIAPSGNFTLEIDVIYQPI